MEGKVRGATLVESATQWKAFSVNEQDPTPMINSMSHKKEREKKKHLQQTVQSSVNKGRRCEYSPRYCQAKFLLENEWWDFFYIYIFF